MGAFDPIRVMRSPIFLAILLLLFQAGPVAAARAAENSSMGSCLRMSVFANDIASSGGQARQHYRISFQNLCDSVRVVYWCAEHPSKTLTANSVCSQRATIPAGIAAPLFAVTRQREFQWTFPQGTRIKFVDCDDSTYPSSDMRCVSPGRRGR